jgi:hypothetical protein
MMPVPTPTRLRRATKSRLLLAASVACVAAATFGLTSYLVSDRTGAPDLGHQLPARGLPSVALSTKTQTAISNLLGRDAALTYGIDRRSFKKVRILARTEIGPLYVVPGTHGQCIVLAPALSCGSVGDKEPTLAVWLVKAGSNRLVGGGLLPAGDHTVDVVNGDGSRTSASLVKGGFAFAQANRPRASGHVRIVVDPRPPRPNPKGIS